MRLLGTLGTECRVLSSEYRVLDDSSSLWTMNLHLCKVGTDVGNEVFSTREKTTQSFLGEVRSFVACQLSQVHDFPERSSHVFGEMAGFYEVLPESDAYSSMGFGAISILGNRRMCSKENGIVGPRHSVIVEAALQQMASRMESFVGLRE